MVKALDYVYLAVYQDKVYELNLHLIIELVKNKTPPTISAVLMPV